MHGEELIVDISAQERVVGHTQLHTDQHRLDTAQNEEGKGADDVDDTDFLMINGGQP